MCYYLTFLNSVRFLIDEAVIKVVHKVDLLRDPPVPADSALKVFPKRDLELHLVPVQIDDTPAGAVHVHPVLLCEHVQTSAGCCVCHIATAI